MFLCVKETSQQHMFLLTVIKIVHISALFLFSEYLKFISNKRVVQKIKIRIFEALLYIVKHKLMKNLHRNH